MVKKAPKELSKESQAVWLSLQREWTFTEADFFLLEKGLRENDRLLEARAVIKKAGLFLKDNRGRVYVNPATTGQGRELGGLKNGDTQKD